MRSAAISARSAACSAHLVIHDAAAGIGFNAAAIEHHLFQGPPPTLHAGFHAGEREPSLDGRVLLRKALVIDLGYGLAVMVWQA